MNYIASYIFLLWLAIIVTACGQRQHGHLPEIQALSEKSGIEMVVIDEAQKITNTTATRFSRDIRLSRYIDDPIKSTIQQESPKSKTVELPGITFLIGQDISIAMVDKLNDKFSYRKYIAFISDDGLPKNEEAVSIIQTSDKYDLLRMQKISGGSYIYSTDSLIKKLKTLDEKYPFDFIGVGTDWCLLRFKSAPADYAAFASDINDVCPLDPETEGSLETYSKWLKEGFEKKNREISMWWD